MSNVGTMKALVMEEIGKVAVREVPIPTLEDGEALLKVAAFAAVI